MSKTTKIGDQIDRYLLDSELGEGGFGTVYKAKHAVTGKFVALKVLHSTEGDLAQRFLQEAKAAAAIGHPNIIDVTDAGVATDGTHFLAMELLEGAPLDAILEERKQLPVGEAVAVMLQILEALGAAHRAGIVHRDLKPANVFITTGTDGRWQAKLLDFGISKMSLPNQVSPQTQTGMMMGTPHYAAPEQLQAAKDLDGRVDLYAASVMLFEMLSGRHPHEAETYERLILKVFSDQPVPLRAFVPDAPPEIEQVIMMGLVKDPAHRFPDAASMAGALQNAAQGVPMQAPSAQIPRTLYQNADTGPFGGASNAFGGGSSQGYGGASVPIAPGMTGPGYSSGMASQQSMGQPMGQPMSQSGAHPSGGSSLFKWVAIAVGALVALGLVVLAGALIISVLLSGSDTTAEVPTPDTPVTQGAVPEQGNPGNAEDAPNIQLQFSGCEVSFEGRLMVQVQSRQNTVSVVAMNGTQMGGQISLMLGPNPPSEIAISTQNRIDTGVLVNIVTSDGVWTNLSAGAAGRRGNDPITGNVRVTRYNMDEGQVDVVFQGVVLEHVSDHTLCTVSGRLRTNGATI